MKLVQIQNVYMLQLVHVTLHTYDFMCIPVQIHVSLSSGLNTVR